jgi:hypothetical protein
MFNNHSTHPYGSSGDILQKAVPNPDIIPSVPLTAILNAIHPRRER